MRIDELLAEGRGNQGPRGTVAVIEHLRGLSPDLLSRTYIHTSEINKVGIKPTDQVSGGGLEPVGIYTYSAKIWLDHLGNTPYRGFPYLHVITLKRNVKQASVQETQRLVREFGHDVFGRAAYGISGRFTKYLLDRGWGTVSQDGYGFIETIILDRRFIERVKTFDAYHLLPGTGLDSEAGVANHSISTKRSGLSKHDISWLKAHPRIAEKLGLIDDTVYHHPDELSRIKLVVHALRQGIRLTPEQERRLLLLPYVTDEDRDWILAAYRESRDILDVRELSKEEQLVLVRNNPYNIQDIPNPSEDVQLAAVSNDGHAIAYIRDPSEAVQLAAVQSGKNLWQVLRKIKNPSPAVRMAALKNSPSEIEFIRNPSREEQLAAVQGWGGYIKYIRDPYPEVVELARKKGFKPWDPNDRDHRQGAETMVQIRPDAIGLFRDPTPKMIELAREKGYDQQGNPIRSAG